MGTFLGQNLQHFEIGAGIGTQFGFWMPPGARVAAYVNSNGSRDGDSTNILQRQVATINEGLKYARSGRGDVVVVMPGHAENIDSADKWSNLVPGTRVVGLGSGALRPTLTWTLAAGSVLMDQVNCTIENINLTMASAANGGVIVAAPITVSAAGCAIAGNKVDIGGDATDHVTIGVTTTAAATEFVFQGNDVVGATAAECTTFLQLVGAANARIIDNSIVGASSATGVGLVRFLTTASTNVKIEGLTIRNNKALSTVAITGMAGAGGEVNDLFMTVLSNNTAALTGAFATLGNFVLGRQCYVANLVGERAALFGTESA